MGDQTIKKAIFEYVRAEGFADYVSGVPQVRNPYEGSGPSVSAWLRGWREAKNGGRYEVKEVGK